MQIVGKFIVTLTDGVDQYHPNGGWNIQRDGQTVAKSEDRAEWSSDIGPLKARLTSVKAGDQLEAASHTGKTGVEGTILKRAGNHLLLQGKAWGPSHSAYAPKGRVGFRTHTFGLVGVDAFYSGSIKELDGLRADHELVRRMEAILFRPATVEADHPLECGNFAPMWA